MKKKSVLFLITLFVILLSMVSYCFYQSQQKNVFTYKHTGRILTVYRNDKAMPSIEMSEDTEYELNIIENTKPDELALTGEKFLINDFDINFDGVNDIGLLSGNGYGGVNYYYTFFIYNKSMNSLEAAPDLVDISNPQVDIEKKTIVSNYRSGPYWYLHTFKYEDGKYIDLGETPETPEVDMNEEMPE